MGAHHDFAAAVDEAVLQDVIPVVGHAHRSYGEVNLAEFRHPTHRDRPETSSFAQFLVAAGDRDRNYGIFMTVSTVKRVQRLLSLPEIYFTDNAPLQPDI
jgi:hypothetical protein